MPRARIPPPWKTSPRLQARRAKLARLKRKGFLPAMTKAQQRMILDANYRESHPVVVLEDEARGTSSSSRSR